jgi:isoleucyl-tRNA synthetase
MHDGPPFTTGKSHIGNMYNKVLKDIINRYKLLRGYKVHFSPGFDCFGSHNEDFHSVNSDESVSNLDISFSNNSKVSTEPNEIIRRRK